jgi:AraC-like DNA-binding protein
LLARARAVTLTNFREIARLVGLDPFAMLGRAGLHPSALNDPENWLAAGRVLDLLEDCARQSGRDDFSILLGECRSFASLGPVSLVLRHESKLREIIAAMIQYRRLLNELLDITLRVHGRTAIVEWHLIPGLRSTQGIYLLATIAYRVLVHGAGIDWQPECIHFRNSPPASIATFRRVFGCPVEFDSGFDGISCTSACLDRRNECADPELARHAHTLLQLMPGIRGYETVSDRARSVIPFLIANGQVSAEDVASSLGIQVRTLQRKLISEGQSFSGILNGTRRELALRYLANSNQSITAVAQLVGYSALSSFTRWFVSELGTSPGRWRRLIRQRDALFIGPQVGEHRTGIGTSLLEPSQGAPSPSTVVVRSDRAEPVSESLSPD